MSDPIEIFERYSYADFARFPEDFYCELIDGIIYLMGSPSFWHQHLVVELVFQLRTFLEGKKCRVLVSPFDVRLFPESDDSDDTVVIPDIIVVCDSEKLSTGKSCKGAPDFIIEVLSPSTEKRDLITKKSKYAKAEVKECWFISRETVLKCVLSNGSFIETTILYQFNREPIPIDTLPGLKLTIPVLD